MSARQELDVIVSIRDLNVTKKSKPVCRVGELTVQRGERLGIVGPNGSGKSTLLRVLASFESSWDGQLELSCPQREIVFVNQSPRLFRGSVIHNVEYGLRARQVPKADRSAQARDWLQRLGVASLSERNVSKLSGGEVRRVAIAQACVFEPQLLLLDEPTADLDEGGIERLREALSRLDKTTILIASPGDLHEGFVSRTFRLTS